MQKGVSILFVLVILLSGAQFTIATHYCGGKVAATKVSLSGKLASCGMESNAERIPFQGKLFTSYCCEDRVTTFGILNNFTQPVLIQTKTAQNNIQVFYLPVSQSYSSLIYPDHFYTNIGPPGGFPASAVNLNYICSIRI